MEYQVRKGIVLTKICDEYLLVAAKEARKYCPAVIQINETAAKIWELIRANKNTDEIIDYFSEMYEVDNSEEMVSKVTDFIRTMHDRGYLLEVNEK